MNVRARIMLYNQVSGHRSSFIGFEPPIGPLPVSQNQLVKSWCNIAYAPTVCSYLTYRTLVIFAISLELHVYNKVYKYKIFKRLRERERERENISLIFSVLCSTILCRIIVSGMNLETTMCIIESEHRTGITLHLGWIMYHRQKSRHPAASGYFSFIESLSRETLYAQS